MIKLVAFDLIGVLACENNYELNQVDIILESFFGQNNSDKEYVEQVKMFLTGEEGDILESASHIIDNLYEPKNQDVIDEIMQINNSVTIIIASNHITYIRQWIEKNINLKYISKIYISAEMGVSKPIPEFYNIILREQHIKSNEMLLIDDTKRNIDGANEIGINTIWYDRKSDLSKLVLDYLDKEKI